MDLGWSPVLQALILAVCTWYMRNGSKRDAESLRRSSASQATAESILDRLMTVEIDLALVKQITLKQNAAGIDHRGPIAAKGK